MSDTTIRIKRIPQEQSVPVSTESEHTISVDGENQEQIISVLQEQIEETISIEQESIEQTIDVKQEQVNLSGAYPYTGAYFAIPKCETSTQVFATKDKRMTDDFLVYTIPTTETYNAQGGVTFTIGE